MLDAAFIELAERGLAGARVDAIAMVAAANKQAIYAYYGSKEGLSWSWIRATIAPSMRDGRIAAIDDGMPDSAWVAQTLRRPVVEAPFRA